MKKQISIWRPPWGPCAPMSSWAGFLPFTPVRLMEGCDGAQAPAGDRMERFTAAQVRVVYRGNPTELPSDGQWYQPYVDY